MAAGLSPPKQVIAHAHWTTNKSKMSKSKGNVADPFEAMKKYGVDSVRWYLMRVGGSLPGDAGEFITPTELGCESGTDAVTMCLFSDYSAGEMEKHYKLLASQVGNLASRIASSKLQKRFLQASSSHPDAVSLVHPEVQALRKLFLRCRDVLEERLDGLEISRGLEEAMDMVFEVGVDSKGSFV
jgi:methionyl-tRNA synthetase